MLVRNFSGLVCYLDFLWSAHFHVILLTYREEINWFLLRICSAFRTPICRGKRGGFKDTFPEDLLAPVLKVSTMDLVLADFVNSRLRINVLSRYGVISVYVSVTLDFVRVVMAFYHYLVENVTIRCGPGCCGFHRVESGRGGRYCGWFCTGARFSKGSRMSCCFVLCWFPRYTHMFVCILMRRDLTFW